MIEVIVHNGELTQKETEKYVDYLQTKHNRKLQTLNIYLLDNDEVDLYYKFEPVCFERIRRITGYLTGDTKTWNDAKLHELDDRVVHGGMVDINDECSCVRGK